MRILVMSAGIGSGHNRAAAALNKACGSFSGVESKWEDTLKYTSRFFRAMYADSYIFVTNKSPIAWGIIYEVANKRAGEPMKGIVKTIDQMAYQRAMKMIIRYNPDAVICTHFLPANVILAHKGGHRSKIPVYVVITDYDAHMFWINYDATGYFVASDEVKWLLQKQGYPEERIRVTGIPTDPVFSQNSFDPSALRDSFGLARDVPVILFTSGGYGATYMKDAMDHILKIDRDFQLLFIAGRNKKIQVEMEKLAVRDKRVHVYGFVNNMQDFMKASDFIVAKSGGLTVAESIAAKLPMVICLPTPGHEERNCDFLLENGAAVKATSLKVLDYKIKNLLDHPEKLKLMREQMHRICPPEAARTIVGHVVKQRSLS